MFQLKPEDRLKSWREFRARLDLVGLEEALELTLDFWSGAPFVPFNLDPDLPKEWPDPWTLVSENSYCDVAKCLGIIYTIALTTHKKDLDIEFRIYEDPKTQLVYNLAWINSGKYILNMIDGQIVNTKQFNKKLKLKKQYSEAELQLNY